MGILQGTIPDDWDGEYCRYAVCWPASPQWLAVLRGVLSLPTRGRFWDAGMGSIIGAQDALRPTLDENLHLEGVIMACNDPGVSEIASSLALIAAAMRENGANCCDGQGSGGAGANAVPFTPPSGLDPSTDPPPAGYDSWVQFYTQKCATAHDIVENLERDLGTMAVIQWGSAGAEALTAALLIILVTPVPAAAAIALVFFLLTVAATVIVSTALSIVVDNEEALVCELYNGGNSEASRDSFLSKFSDLADSLITDPVEAYACKVVLSYMVSSNVTNRMFEANSVILLPERDCQGCFEGCSTCIRRYDKDYNPMQYYDVPRDWAELDDQGGQGLHTTHFHATGADHYRILWRALTGHTHYGTPDFLLQRDNADIIYSGDDFAAFAVACSENAITSGPNVEWQVRSSSQFTVEIKIEFVF